MRASCRTCGRSASLDDGRDRLHIAGMNSVLPILIAIAVAATFGALALGIISMARGGQFASRNSNKLMRLRVIFQFAALVLIGLAFLFSNK